jgi:multiple sugar transport system ATP-binding protein
MAGVRLQEVTMRYPGADGAAVERLSLDIADREFFVLLGPSGCGKSTLLKLIGGLEEPSAGRVYFGDELVNFVSPSRRNVAMVFQSYALYPQLNVLDNIAFPLRMRRVRRAERERAASAVAGTLGLEPLLGRAVSQLSGGQRQRVAVARALVRRPRVLRVEMREELVRLHRETETTVVYVTHDQVEATTMADRIGVMADGRLEQVGTPDQVYGRPANRFVAGFVGSPPMSFVEGHGDGASFRADGVRVTLDGRRASGPLVLGVRPDAVRLTEPADGDARGEVQLLESLGGDTIVVVRVGAQLLRALVRRDERPEEGAAVGLALDPAQVHVFDESGAAVR